MLHRTFPLVALLVARFATAGAAADRYDCHEKTLENGLSIVTIEDRSCPIVAVQVWYHVGSKDESPERNGFAHMFEHMMFRGTDRLGPEDHFELIRGVGGDCNAYTAFDQTVYVQEVPSNQVPLVFWLEAERMSALRVDEEGFQVERAVVEEERRMGLNQPYGSVAEKLLAQVFREHPYRWSPIGNIAHLRAATSEELLRFWETYYVPNNATLVVVGDVDHEWVEAEAEKAFGWIPRCDDPPRVTVREPLYEKPVDVVIKEERGPVPIVGIGYRTVPMDHPDALPLEMLMSIVGGGETSRIYRRIVEEEDLAPMAMGAAVTMEHEGFAGAAAMAMPFGDLDGIAKALDEELERVRTESVDETELSKVKANFRRNLVDEALTAASKANLVGTAYVFHGGEEWLNARAARIESISADDLQRVAEVYFVPERRVDVRIKPTLGGMVKTLLGGLTKRGGAEDEDEHAHDEKEKPATSTMAERRGPKADAKRPDDLPASPPVAKLLAARVPMDSVSRKLDNGLEVVIVENHEVPVVNMHLGLLNGAFLDPEEKPGTAALAGQMLTKGTKGRNAQSIADELESNAVTLSGSAGMDSAAVRGSAVAGQLGRLARLMADIVKYPTFPEDEFSTLKRQVLTGMSIAEKSPEAMAEREFARGLFGGHFYAREDSGTSDDVKRIETSDCRGWWSANARPDQAVLYFAGDVEPDVAFDLAEAFFGDWSVEGEPPRAKIEPIPDPEATRIVLVDVPGAIQSQIRVGHLGIRRGDSRYAGGRILTQVFGGAFNSRLNKTIRVEKGLTYGARGGLRSDRFAGRFFVSTFSKTASTSAAVEAILGEIRRMRDEAPSEKEMTQAKSYIVGSFAGDHETPHSIANELWSLRLHGLDKGDVERFLDSVAKITSEDVQKVARSVIDPERLFIVVVGDASAVKADLEEIAPVTVLEENGEERKAS